MCCDIYVWGGGNLLKWLVCLSCLMLMCVCVCVGGGGGGLKEFIYFIKMAKYGAVLFLFAFLFAFLFLFLHYTCDFILLPFSFTVSLSVHVFSCDCN